ncbi:MAG TPA: alternative ribosome rescue aminoacyl-tRNA hydrolase ArfB [Patescibacteria group bacterium]|nr:alternative ribosome rescue aminoacyl-tRNA hydrolase ArfB [Patescibacteria group bacterium]
MTTDEAEALLRESEVVIEAIRAQGKGGQNVNKVSNAVHLRFDIRASSLPDPIKTRLLSMSDRRVTSEGVVVIKAQTERSLEANREDALARLRALIAAAAIVPRPRRPTRTTRSAKRRRMDSKTRRGRIKALRGRVEE